MLFKSTALLPGAPATKRRPFTNTKVLLVPNPRKSVLLKPFAKTLLFVVSGDKPTVDEGIWLYNSATFVMPALTNESPVKTVIGVGDNSPRRFIFEPVT